VTANDCSGNVDLCLLECNAVTPRIQTLQWAHTRIHSDGSPTFLVAPELTSRWNILFVRSCSASEESLQSFFKRRIRCQRNWIWQLSRSGACLFCLRDRYPNNARVTNTVIASKFKITSNIHSSTREAVGNRIRVAKGGFRVSVRVF
jgi:hypothetical protein